MEPGDIDVTIDDDVLTIAGKREHDSSVAEGQWIRRERMTGEFRRSISLPPGTDPGQITATATNGVVDQRSTDTPADSAASGTADG